MPFFTKTFLSYQQASIGTSIITKKVLVRIASIPFLTKPTLSTQQVFCCINVIMDNTFADRVKQFNRHLRLAAKLPSNIGVLNPFKEETIALQCADTFYDKYYGDNVQRWGIFGINPSRFGGGLTGIPFTDFKRLQEVCSIDTQSHSSHEPSSFFIYKMIAAMGGADGFYRQFYINSLCPLGFVITKMPGKWVNYNYYDDPALYAAVKPFIIKTLRQQIDLGLHTDTAFCLGKKNYIFFQQLNAEKKFFGKVVELPHPRFVVQYRYKLMDEYITEYCEKLSAVLDA
jgi:hypothetical protein